MLGMVCAERTRTKLILEEVPRTSNQSLKNAAMTKTLRNTAESSLPSGSEDVGNSLVKNASLKVSRKMSRVANQAVANRAYEVLPEDA